MKALRKTALICFYNEHGQILLQERGIYSKCGEEWAFFGGGIEPGETPIEGFFREAREELGLNMSKFPYTFVGEYYTQFPDRDVYRYLYVIPTNLKAEDFEVGEGIGARYFTLDQARALKFPSPVDHIIDGVKDVLDKKD